MRLNDLFAQPRRVMVGCLLSPLMVAAGAFAQNKPAAAPAAAQPKTPAALAYEAKKAAAAADKATRDAAIKLMAEYKAGTAKDTKTPLRDKSDYFSTDKQGVTEETIMAMLCSVITPDAGADSYIKWQMLSALPAKDDDAALPKMILAYRGSSVPYPRPGMSAAEKSELDTYIRPITNPDGDAINKINDMFKPFVDAWEVHNTPVLAYRDAMEKRLPMSAEGIMARLEDGHARQGAGIDAEKFGLRMRDTIVKWDDKNPPEPQRQAMAALLLKFINEQGGVPAKPKTTMGPDIRNEAFAAATPLGDDARAPVILAAGYRAPNYGGTNMNNGNNGNNGNGNYKMGGFPPKFYEYVKVGDKPDKLVWATGTGKFMTKDQMVTVYEALKTPNAPAAPAAAAAK